jgi:hypothetical protein
MATIKDREAKDIFLNPKYWPRLTLLFSLNNQIWLQCRPKRAEFKLITFPHLHTAGSGDFWIDPDCFYVRVSGTGLSRCCDVICAEVCNALQNFQQKRGRYLGTEAALFVNLPKNWLEAAVEVNKKYREYIYGGPKVATLDRHIPVRTLRVMYFLDPTYFKGRLGSIDPRPWEYFLPNTSIRSLNSKSMRTFVRAISPDAQFYGWQ